MVTKLVSGMECTIQIGGRHRYDTKSFHNSNLQQYGKHTNQKLLTAPSKGEIILYQTADGSTSIDVKLENENVCLTQAQMAMLTRTTWSSRSMMTSRRL